MYIIQQQMLNILKTTQHYSIVNNLAHSHLRKNDIRNFDIFTSITGNN